MKPNIYKKYVELTLTIKESRNAKYLSQRKLSSKLDMSNSYITHVENGNVQPSLNVLKKISSILEIPYVKLAFLAKYIDNETYNKSLSANYNPRLLHISDLNDREWATVENFIEFVKSQRTD